MAGSMGGRVPQKVTGPSFFGRLRRGAIITSVGILVCGVVSVFVPFVPLTVAVVIGGVGGGALANATDKK